MINTAVNTDPLPAILNTKDGDDRFRLKERNVPHIRIKDGSQLKQDYEFGEKIGEGAFGTVLSVIDKKYNKKWAMKTVAKSLGGQRLMLVNREIKILKLIKHPHIIYLAKVFESQRRIYMIFEMCYGELVKIYGEEKPFTEIVAKRIIRDLADALTYLHKYDIVHRDLKLENILIGANPDDPSDKYYVKLTDFGLSIVKFGKGIDDMLHEFCGTLFYMSPEMITSRSYSQQCDNWALGVILYMFVQGRYPFYSTNEADLQRQICKSVITFDNFKLSDPCKDLTTQLLIKDPANRFTAAEVLQHPWITDATAGVQSCNILQIMKEWKSEMTVTPDPEGRESDWVSTNATTFENNKRLEESKRTNSKRQMNLPKTEIVFERGTLRRGSTQESLVEKTPRGASRQFGKAKLAGRKTS